MLEDNILFIFTHWHALTIKTNKQTNLKYTMTASLIPTGYDFNLVLSNIIIMVHDSSNIIVLVHDFTSLPDVKIIEGNEYVLFVCLSATWGLHLSFIKCISEGRKCHKGLILSFPETQLI